ncbi:TPA: hypothetical protein ACH3X1_009201 [Trebouxia sp. C0004]
MEEGAAVPFPAAAEEANADLPQAQQLAAELQPGGCPQSKGVHSVFLLVVSGSSWRYIEGLRVGDFDKLHVTGDLSYAMKLCDKRVRNFELDTVWTRISNGPADPAMSQGEASLE